jgi:hypothetical protein
MTKDECLAALEAPRCRVCHALLATEPMDCYTPPPGAPAYRPNVLIRFCPNDCRLSYEYRGPDDYQVAARRGLDS